MNERKRHYKPESERRVRVAGTVSPENAAYVERIATEMNVAVSWVIDAIIEAHRKDASVSENVYGKPGEK